jgi:hypothetical protein
MHPSYPFEPTPEDARIILKWKLRLALFYGALLLIVVLFGQTRPQDHIADPADVPAKQALSSAASAARTAP